FSDTVARFCASGSAEEYTAIIDWGDGSSSSGSIASVDGHFEVSGEHKYSEEGGYAVTVTVSGVGSLSEITGVTHSALLIADPTVTFDDYTATAFVGHNTGFVTGLFHDAGSGELFPEDDYQVWMEFEDHTTSSGSTGGSGLADTYAIMAGSHLF